MPIPGLPVETIKQRLPFMAAIYFGKYGKGGPLFTVSTRGKRGAVVAIVEDDNNTSWTGPMRETEEEAIEGLYVGIMWKLDCDEREFKEKADALSKQIKDLQVQLFEMVRKNTKTTSLANDTLDNIVLAWWTGLGGA